MNKINSRTTYEQPTNNLRTATSETECDVDESDLFSNVALC